MKCIKCNKEHDGSFGSGKYCSRACANSRTHSVESKKKTSASMKKFIEVNGYSWLNIDNTDEDRRERQKATWLKKLMDKDFESLGWDSKRKRVLVEQKYTCGKCGLDHWLGEQIALEVDHIDGDTNNNDRSNLIALCPNCHAQTDTWRGKNNFVKKIKDKDTVLDVYLECGNIHKTLIKMGMSPRGDNYKNVRKILIDMGIEF